MVFGVLLWPLLGRHGATYTERNHVGCLYFWDVAKAFLKTTWDLSTRRFELKAIAVAADGHDFSPGLTDAESPPEHN